jgi:hypothetical protein
LQAQIVSKDNSMGFYSFGGDWALDCKLGTNNNDDKPEGRKRGRGSSMTDIETHM